MTILSYCVQKAAQCDPSIVVFGLTTPISKLAMSVLSLNGAIENDDAISKIADPYPLDTDVNMLDRHFDHLWGEFGAEDDRCRAALAPRCEGQSQDFHGSWYGWGAIFKVLGQ